MLRLTIEFRREGRSTHWDGGDFQTRPEAEAAADVLKRASAAWIIPATFVAYEIEEVPPC